MVGSGDSEEKMSPAMEKMHKDIMNRMEEMINRMEEMQVAQNRKIDDLEGRMRDFTVSARGMAESSGYRSGEPRYGYPGRALQERPEDKEELGLFF